ncbi:DUF2911 domain-containing protein [Poritiphilus flavus]|uniref:DUF2911 domain-containing protein n=1 Tax=Poritiphilus flavus TaxID=2697053 RepID=A0A6L9EAT0_9FLAO|nr:DUF2911 domain-containing protein [Poritiphilus flavus]NAS11885.1 DUF2911 domain-containing protein [Poritiphilus flavus]
MKLLLSIGLLLLCPFAWGQIEHPKASPFSRIEQQIGLSKITVEYSRPAVRGREIFGDLVPYGRIWRVGANASTKFTTDTDLTIGGSRLPAGTYALYAFPEEQSWQIVFHTNTGHWGDGRKAYNPKEDAFRIRLTPEKISDKQENFLITFDEIDHNSMKMLWLWDRTRITIPISVDTHAAMQREISRKITDKPTAQTYYEAGRYLQEQGKDFELALDYLNKALEQGGDTYYFHRVKSLVEAALGDFPSAIVSAQKSLELASAEGKDEFVRMNQKNIDDWKSVLKANKNE